MTESSPPATKRPNVFRMRYFVDVKLQVKLIVFFFFISIVQMVVIYFTYKMAIAKYRDNLPVLDPQLKQSVLLVLDEYGSVFIRYFAIFSVISLLYLLIGGILLSHSLAGPIFAARRFIRSVTAGETPRPLKLRKSDFFVGLSDDLNALVKKIRPEIYSKTERAGDGHSAGPSK